MDLPDLIDGLSRPTAYPMPVDAVEVVQTHISVVFLAGDRAYKIKKPVDLGFLDFSTLDRRRKYCLEEVRLNSRAAPGVYMGVVAVTAPAGVPVIGGAGEAVEYAVEMLRLPPDRTLAALLDAGALDGTVIHRLGGRVAEFHRGAECGPHLSRWGGWLTVAGNVRENFDQLEPYIGRSVSAPVQARLRACSEAALDDLREPIERRAMAGRTCDTHGDLHLQHVYFFPDRAPPADFVLVDCIEFNERFRYADPVADLAFLVMDLKYRGRADLSGRLAEAYFAASDDAAGAALLSFYTAYRAVVRGKVESFVLDQPTVPDDARARALARARPYLLLALGELLPPPEKPCIVLAAGLPGTGKSLVAEGLVATSGFVRVSTDVERKRLAGVPAGREASVRLDPSAYTAESTLRTYEACLERASGLLFEGRRVVLDGTFRERAWRRRVSDLAREWSAPLVGLVCEAPPSVVEARLSARTDADSGASDADWSVYRLLADRWEAIDEDERVWLQTLDAAGAAPDVLARARARLASAGVD